MGIVYQKDQRSGITYAYESKAVWIKELKQSRATRRLIGRLDEETGEIIPTDGRCRKRSPSYDPKEEALSSEYPEAIEECHEEIKRLRKENATLRKRLAKLERK